TTETHWPPSGTRHGRGWLPWRTGCSKRFVATWGCHEDVSGPTHAPGGRPAAAAVTVVHAPAGRPCAGRVPGGPRARARREAGGGSAAGEGARRDSAVRPRHALAVAEGRRGAGL